MKMVFAHYELLKKTLNAPHSPPPKANRVTAHFVSSLAVPGGVPAGLIIECGSPAEDGGHTSGATVFPAGEGQLADTLWMLGGEA